MAQKSELRSQKHVHGSVVTTRGAALLFNTQGRESVDEKMEVCVDCMQKEDPDQPRGKELPSNFRDHGGMSYWKNATSTSPVETLNPDDSCKASDADDGVEVCGGSVHLSVANTQKTPHREATSHVGHTTPAS